MKNVFLLFLISSNLYATDFVARLVDRPLKKVKLEKFLQQHKIIRAGKIRFVTVSAKELDIFTKKEQKAFFKYIEPNRRYYALKIPQADVQDTLFPEQWGILNITRTWLGREKRGADSNVVEAWNYTQGDRDIIVAIIDSGIDITHPDLRDNLWVNRLELQGEAGVDDDQNGFIDDIYGYDFVKKEGLKTDEMGHGTHCAGVIGAVHNDIGIAGVMANVQLMGVKFYNGDGGALIDAIKAITYAVNNGAKILSNSWGGYGFSQALKDTIAWAAKRGVTFVAAAGNSYTNNDKDPLYPASYKLSNIISVGAMTKKGKKSSFSNYGKKSVHIFAPGSSILSTVPRNNYTKMSGTSMATPHVAGVIGLMLSVNPYLTPKQQRTILIDSAHYNSHLSSRSISKGYVDAAKAVQAAESFQ